MKINSINRLKIKVYMKNKFISIFLSSNHEKKTLNLNKSCQPTTPSVHFDIEGRVPAIYFRRDLVAIRGELKTKVKLY